MKKPPRARTARRKADRQATSWKADVTRLFRLSEGGDAQRPRLVSSASVVEPEVTGTPCAACNGNLKILEHRAETLAGRALRVVDTQCKDCAARWTFYLQIRQPS